MVNIPSSCAFSEVAICLFSEELLDPFRAILIDDTVMRLKGKLKRMFYSSKSLYIKINLEF